MKKNIITLFVLLLSYTANAQESNFFINRTTLGYNTFNIDYYDSFNTSGMSLSNETIFHFNKYINPGIRISLNTGSNISSDIILFNNTISLNGYIKELSLKKHHLQIGGGASCMFTHYNYHNGNLNPSVGYLTLGYNWQIKYLFSISKTWDVGIEFSQLYTKYDMKISSLTLVSGFNFHK